MGSTTKRGYWFPAGNDAVALFPGQNELLFMKKLDTDMDTALTANIAAARIPNLAASKITSGRFSDARIPTTIARTADVPSLEIDESAGTKISLGGRMIFYDSGWRNVTADLWYGWKAVGVFLRRELGRLTIAIYGPDSSEATDYPAIGLPKGFSPDIPTSGSIAIPLRSADAGKTVWVSADQKQINLSTEAAYYQNGWNYIILPANDTLYPNSLPGNPA